MKGMALEVTVINLFSAFKSAVQRQVCFSIRAFVEIDTSNARNFVILPVFLVI